MNFCSLCHMPVTDVGAKRCAICHKMVRGDLHNARYDFCSGEAYAVAAGGQVVSRRVDTHGVEMTTYRIPFDNHRGELLYIWRRGPHGYEWSIV